MRARQTTTPDEGWFSRQRVLTLVLGLMTVLALYVCYLIVEPFLPTLILAMALAIATNRPYRWLARRLPNESLASAVAVILVALIIIGPLVTLGIFIGQQLVTNLQQVESGFFTHLHEKVYAMPALGPALRWIESNVDIQGQLAGLAKGLASRAGDLLAGSVGVITQVVIMLFVLFFLYRDRDAALAMVHDLVPLSSDEANKLFSRIADTILATINGSLTVALAQAVLAGTMYTILGVPAALLWGAATFIVALIPVFGTFMVWGPIAAYLAISGSWVKALVLVGWGMLAVGTIDNVLYPYLVGGRLRLHTVPTFFAILGGVGLFGPVGLILGPIALAMAIGLLDVWWMRTSEGRSAEEEPAASDQGQRPETLLRKTE